MMKKQFLTVRAGDENFPACWDMTAWATFEKLSGSENAFAGFTINASNVLDALWAAIDAAAAHRDEDAPITRRRLGTLFTSIESMNNALETVSNLIEGFMPEPQPGKVPAAPAATPSQLPDAINSAPSISGSASVSSGV